MTFPTAIADITPSFLTDVLGQTVTAVSASPLGAPYTSVVVLLTLTLEGGAQTRLVAKCAKANWKTPQLYEQEVRFFREVAQKLGSAVPRVYFAQIHDGAFLLLLDLVEGQHPTAGLDLADARSVLQALANVHGRSWDRATIRENWPHRHYTGEQGRKLRATLDDNWAQVQRRFPTELGQAPTLSGFEEGLAQLIPSTLTHNDLHADNILHSEHQTVFIDWQNACYSSPMVDVANVLVGCVKPQVQRDHWRQLLGDYQTALILEGGPRLPHLTRDYANGVRLLFLWNFRYLATVSDEEANQRAVLRSHWQRVSTGIALVD